MNGEMVKNPIEAAARLSRRATTQEIKDASIERMKATGVLANLEQLEANLLPVEQGMLPMVISAKKQAVQRAKQFESLDKLNRYPVFNLEPLTWRDKNGLPRLAAFSTASPYFELAIIGDRNYDRIRWLQEIKPELPKDMQECYKDIFNKLKETAKKNRKTLKLRAQYAGFIPPAIKNKILKAAKEFKNIYIIAEINQWDFEQIAIPRPNNDPLVVGYDGINYWLIATFNPTRLEEFIKAKCSVKHEKATESLSSVPKALPPGNQS